MWRVIGQSVRGTSHLSEDIPCQDYSIYLTSRTGEESTLFIGIADGAGSAKASDEGSKVAVDFFARLAQAHMCDSTGLTPELVKDWVKATQQHLLSYAEGNGVEMSDLACTLLFAVATKSKTYFIQIGDGCWVVQTKEGVKPATWPCQGEFLNYTKFITSEDAADHIQFIEMGPEVVGIAGFSDGVQMLALSLRDKKAHEPFFNLFFDEVRSCADSTSLIAPLRGFLESPQVNERTDDDKTLVIACKNCAL